MLYTSSEQRDGARKQFHLFPVLEAPPRSKAVRLPRAADVRTMNTARSPMPYLLSDEPSCDYLSIHAEPRI